MTWDGRTTSGIGGLRPGTSVITGTAPSSSTKMSLQSFQVTPTTGGGGTVTVNFPTAFANGVQAVTVTLGQMANYVLGVNGVTLSGFTVGVFNPSTGNGVPSTPVTINVMAVGW